MEIVSWPAREGSRYRQREVAEEEGAGRRSVGINQRLPISLVAAKASVEQLTIKLNTHTTLGSWRPCARCTPARAPSNASRSPRSDYCRCLMKSIQVPRSDYYQLRTTHAKCSSKWSKGIRAIKQSTILVFFLKRVQCWFWFSSWRTSPHNALHHTKHGKPYRTVACPHSHKHYVCNMTSDSLGASQKRIDMWAFDN
jgi:hypothetical protein